MDKQQLLNKAFTLLNSADKNADREWYKLADAKRELAWAYIGLADRLSGANTFQVQDKSGIQDV